MTLMNLLVFFVLLGVGSLFWKSRGIAEAARAQVKRYCETNQLQFLSIALASRKFTMASGKPGWLSVYTFEFSGNHEDKYTGTIVMLDRLSRSIDVPAYRVH